MFKLETGALTCARLDFLRNFEFWFGFQTFCFSCTKIAFSFKWWLKQVNSTPVRSQVAHLEVFIILILDFFFWVLIFSEKAFEDQWHFSGCDSSDDRGHWVLTRPGKYKPIIFVLFVCLSNVSKLFYLSCTVPTQKSFKSYLPIYQNDIRLFTTIITGGAWRRFCKTQLQGAWFSTVSFFDHRKKKFYYVHPLHKIFFDFVQPLHKIFFYFVQPLHKIESLSLFI